MLTLYMLWINYEYGILVVDLQGYTSIWGTTCLSLPHRPCYYAAVLFVNNQIR